MPAADIPAMALKAQLCTWLATFTYKLAETLTYCKQAPSSNYVNMMLIKARNVGDRISNYLAL